MSYKLVKVGSNSGDILVATEDLVSQIEFASPEDALKARDEMGLDESWLPLESENVAGPGLEVWDIL